MTYETIEFADPFKACTTCGKQVTAVLLVGTGQARNRCDGKWMGHIGYTDTCPSWSPVDGCLCLEHLGYVPHLPAPSAASASAEPDA